MRGNEPGSCEATWQALLALRPRLRRFACGLTGSLDEGDDLVQAAYQRAFERLGQWAPGTRLDSWMLKITHNIWISRRRQAAVRAGPGGEPVDPDTLVGCDGERAIVAKLTLAEVRRLVAKLPEEQRAALMLVAVDGLSYAHAAEVLGVPPGTLASRLARARLTLTAALDGGLEREVAGEITGEDRGRAPRLRPLVAAEALR
jgi:RNA polymerase sigma-70 factor (ECF subfamily)